MPALKSCKIDGEPGAAVFGVRRSGILQVLCFVFSGLGVRRKFLCFVRRSKSRRGGLIGGLGDWDLSTISLFFFLLWVCFFFFSWEDATLTLIVAGMQSVLLNDQFPVAIAVAVAFHLPNGIN